MSQLAAAHECCPTLHSGLLLVLELLARLGSLEAVLTAALCSRGQASLLCEVATVQSRAMVRLCPASHPLKHETLLFVEGLDKWQQS